ncbi:MAG: DUF370 domain-containing protein [Clostridia bacterium]|nr:DUF370 domain-containing protein [Clostridia bacterium]
MFCHVGAGTLINDRDVVGIFDLDGEITTATTAGFLKEAEKGKKTISASYDIPRAFVLVSGNKEEVIFTRLSVSAVTKRIEAGIEGEF